MVHYLPLSSLNHIHFHIFSLLLFFHNLSLIIGAAYCKNKGDSEEDVQGIKGWVALGCKALNHKCTHKTII